MTNLIQYFIHLHDVEVNQKYADTLPYSFHLHAVAAQHTKFQHLLKNKADREITFIGCYAHDSIEDGRLSYNDIVKMHGNDLAEIVFLCTDFKGRNRAERKPIELYIKLAENDLALFVKLCDLIANVKYSLLTNSRMFSAYKMEYYDKMKPYAYDEKYKEMFNYIESLLQIAQ
jgi:(p)ppGpp synthase/HD superfamily hydrolase